MEVLMLSVKVDGRKRSNPKATNRVGQIATDPRMSARWEQDRCGHLCVDGRGLVAMYPMNPNRKPANMMSHGAKRHPWSTRWWVEESKGKKVEVEVEAWTAMPSMEIWTGVEWSVSGQWKRMPAWM